ncbi:hypothetical protein Tco_0945736 [Tanacetum coccineum]
MRAKTIEHTTSLIAQNAEFKAQLQEKGFAIAALKNELRKLTGNSVNTKFAKQSILGKPFASQVDVNNDLSKPVTTHYLPKERESAVVKPHHVIASSESRNSSKNMPRFSSNDMVHNHYLEEAKKKTQESKPSVIPFARSTSTTNGRKPKPRINNQSNEPSSSKLVPKFVPPADKRATSQQELELLCSPMYEEYFNVGNPSVSKSSALSDNSTQHDTQPTLNAPPTSELTNPPTNVNAEENISKAVNKSPTHYPCDIARTFRVILFSIHHDEWKSFQSQHQTALRWKSRQGDSSKLNLPDHRWRWRYLIPVESDSLPHAHAQTTKTYYKHQDSRIKKAQELKTKTFANSDIKDPSLETKLQGRLLASFQDDAKYEHVG